MNAGAPCRPSLPRALLAGAVVVALLCGCRTRPAGRSDGSSEPPTPEPWPVLPASAAEARALVAERSVRSTDGLPDATFEAPALLERIAQAARGGAVAAGAPGVLAWIQLFAQRAADDGRDVWILWGTSHDAAGQVTAFRRLVGPGGLRDLTLVAAEQFFADGGWAGADPQLRRGDDADLIAWVRHGDSAARRRLVERHRTGDYAAWKFDYEAEVLELLETARAAGLTLRGCNMPLPLQERTGLPPLDHERLRLRLRELHCFLALAPFPAPRRVALLWGRDHVRADGFPRFLPPSAAVLALHVFGHRPGAETLEAELARRIVVLDPLLVPLDDDHHEAAVLLPDAVLGGDVDRSADRPERCTGTAGRLLAAADAPGRLTVHGTTIELDGADRELHLPAGEHPFAAESGGLLFLGRLTVDGGCVTELWLAPAERYVRILHRR